MDSVGDWLAQSPPRVADAGEDLAWLCAGLIDNGAVLAEDEICLEDFTGQEFFHDSPPSFAGGDTEHAPLQQLSASSQPTSSGDDPNSTCGGDGACGDTSSTGMGHFTRAGAFRSFSTNDLELLLEQPQQQANLLPPVAGLSAPPHHYGGLVSMAGAKAKTRPALESVPEGAPSPGGPLPAAPAAMAVRTDSAIVGGGGVRVSEPGTGVTSPLPVTPTGASSVEYLSRSAPQPFLSAQAAANPFSTTPGGGVAGAQEVPAGVSTATASAASSTQRAAPLMAPEAGGATFNGSRVNGGLRHIPSTGTLSALMNNTLNFQREAAEEATHQQQHQQQQSPSPPQHPQPQHEPRKAAESAAAPAAAATAAPQALTAPAAEYGLGAAAGTAGAAAKAAAASVFPQGAIPGVLAPQSYPLPPPVCMYGMASQPYTSVPSYPHSPYALGLPLPLPPAGMLAGPPMGADDAAAAQHPCASAPVGGEVPVGSFGGAPRGLRKSQSALELGAWRSASLELPPDVAEGAAVTGQKLIGRLTPEERLQRILRYRHKRNMRNFNREIKYQCRKTLADSRPRVGGRFARNDDPNSVLPHQTKKALRARHGTGSVAAAAPEAQQQQEPGRDVKTASSSSITASATSSSDNQATRCTSAGTAAPAAAPGGALPYVVKSTAAVAPPQQLAPAAAAAADRPPTAAQHPDGASAFASACGLPYSYSVQGMPYAVHGLYPGVLPPAAAAALPPPAEAAMCQRVHAAALQHHYAVVNAAAQAAAQSVYAHLGMAPAAAPMPLHAPVLAGCAFGAATAASAAAAAAGSVASAGTAAVKVEVSGGSTGPTLMALGPAPAAVPPRIDMPPLDALWTHRGAALGVQTAADGGCQPSLGALVLPAGGGATCMAVDG